MLDTAFACQILHLDGCYWIWIGSGGAPCMSNICTAIMTKYEKTPLTTTILGSGMDEGQGMAQRLSRRLGKMIFVSNDLKVAEGVEGQLTAYLERQLLKRLSAA
jgi:hypothetical protein